MDAIVAVYRVCCAPFDIEAAASAIAVEQTVEAPDALIPAEVRERVVGEVASIEPDGDGFLVTLAYRAELANGQIPQLLNLVYGNVAMRDFVRLHDLELPDSFLRGFRGPNFGIEGLRALLGVHDRPLLATALKPRGLADAELARMAHAFALGGGDIAKDDHNLVDDSTPAFRERAARFQEAVGKANARTGGRCLYLPNVSAPVERIEERLQVLVELGVPGLMIAPWVVGLDTLRSLAGRYRLLFLTHPTFSGAFTCSARHGIRPCLLLGLLTRLAGADISVFASFGGRFDFPRQECVEVAERLRRPLGALQAALPCPGGGMRPEILGDLASAYGRDALYLVGGALLGTGAGVADSTARFLDAMRRAFRA